MKTTPQVSARFAQTAWVAYGMSRRGGLAIGWAGSPYGGMIAQVLGDALRAWSPGDRVSERRIPRFACLVRRTGRIAGWREWRQNRAGANRYSQRRKSHEPTFTVRRVLCNVQRYWLDERCFA